MKSLNRHFPGFRPVLLAALIAACYPVAHAAPPAATALPVGGQIVAGQGSIAQAGTAMTVNQNSATMIANWQTFNIGQSASVNFVQPSASAVALNQVLSANPSQIFGSLTANGRVFLVNPSGVYFGPSARVDVGGLTASALNLSNADFLAGRYKFGAGSGTVSNLGEIAAREGGFVALVGATVDNAGKVSANAGQVALAAGQGVTLDITANGLVSVKVDTAGNGARVDNTGTVIADGGRVWMTAKSAAPMLAAAVNQSGIVRANSIATKNGEIWIEGSGGGVRLGGTTEARGAAAGETGGRIVATGDSVTVASGANVDTSGMAGGGSVNLGGGWQGKDAAIAEARSVTVERGATIAADATANGDGGTVVAWSGEITRMDGSISARGAGEGKGGQVETSSRGALGVRGSVDASAPSGRGGSWLLDPNDITITAVATDADVDPTNLASPVNYAPGAPVSVYNSSIDEALTRGVDVTLTTGAGGNIDINANISKTGGLMATLTFDALNNITLNTGVNVASTVGVLNVNFGTNANSGTGTAIIQGSVSTNGGSVVFNKAAQFVSATPVSTKILAPGDVGTSGSITFEKTVVLNNQASSTVTLDTQSGKSGATYTGTGGNILFKDSITSFDSTLPQQLILTTTGKTTGGTNQAGSVTFGNALANSTTEDFVGTAANPLGGLIITGPTYTFLNTSQINLKAPSGNLLTFSTSHPSYVPKLVLGANATTISVTGVAGGGGVDSADYTQSSFDIVTSSGLTNPSLTVQSERSIQVVGSSTQSRKITGDYYDILTGLVAGNKALTVSLKPSQFAGIDSGAIYLDNARIDSYGANVKLGDAGNLAYGVATEQNTDGVRMFESSIFTGGGNLDIWGQAPTMTNLGAVSSAGGIGVHMYGLGTLSTSNGAGTSTGILTINGGVTTASSSAAKDAVVIGRGGSATVTLQTDNGALDITGDASAVTGASAGASYTGIDLSASAMIRSKGGAITLTGSGGGGSASNVGENYGIKLKDSDTQIVSTTGNILLTGLTGGKTTSYGIYAAGDDMALGQERDTTTAKAVTGGTFTGNIDLVADTMKFVNSSTSRLRITGARNGGNLATGQLNIRPYHDATIQIGGTEPSPPSPDSTTLVAPTKPLYLASSMFSGTNAVVIEGFGDITIGRYGVAGTESTKTLTVAGATTVNDSLNLRMLGTGGNIAVDAPLTVQGAAPTPRTLAMHVQAGVAGTGAVTADKLRLIGSGDVLLTGNSFVGTLAAGGPGTADGVTYDGNITLANAQTLTVGQVTSETLGVTATSTGIATANNKNVTLSTTGGDITVKRNITVGSGTVSLVASAGAVNENNADVGTGPIITADKLRVGARDTSTLVSTNVISTTLAGAITGSGQNFNFINDNALAIGTVLVGAGNVDGFTLNGGNAAIKLNNGGLTQTKPVVTGSNTTGGFYINAPGSVILEDTGNDFGKFAATLTGGAGTLSVVDKNTLQLGTSGTSSVSIPGSVGTVAMGGTNIAASGYTAKFWSGATGTGGVNEVDGATVTAAKLLVKANDNSTMVNDNHIANEFSAVVTGTGKTLYFTENEAILVGSVANTTGAIPNPTDGILATGNTVVLNAKTGDITQQANTLGDIIGGSLLLKADNGHITLQNATNDVGTLAAFLGTGTKNFSYRDANALIVGSLTPATGINAGTLAPVLGTAIDGITTTGGIIDLYTLAGSLTVNKSIVAGGASTIDLRAKGATSDIAINDSATVKSVGGATIQLAAGQDISTNTNNGTGSEIETAGSVLLQAGRAIGVDGKRIEMTDVSTLAATAASDMWLRKLGSTDDLTIGTVATIAQGNTVTDSAGTTSNASAVAVANLSGLTTTANNGKITMTTQGGDLTITQAVTSHGAGYVDIRTANAGNLGDIAINNGATISSTSGTVQLISGSTITTNSANNTAAEINTEGTALLEAGKAIGSDSNRIEMRNVATVAGRTLSTGLNNDLWLRKLSGATGGGTNNLTVGRVDGVNTGLGAAAEVVASTGTTALDNTLATGLGFEGGAAAARGLDGLVTSGNSGKVTLTTMDGDLTVVKSIVANGGGYIDLRTGGTARNINLNGVTTVASGGLVEVDGVLKSTTGAVQLIATGDIATNSVNNTADEIVTAGNALLVSGGAIGADGKRIESSGVNALAAQSVGGQWLRQRVGNLTVGSVTALTPIANTLDNTAASKDGLVNTAGDAAIALNVAAGSLTVVKDVVTSGNGTIDLRTGGANKAIAINGATLKSGALGVGSGTVQVIASGDISTTTTSGTTNEIGTTGNVLLDSGGAIGSSTNRIEMTGVNTMAARSVASQYLAQTSGDLTVGTVAALTPGDTALDIAATSGSGMATSTAVQTLSLTVVAGNMNVANDINALATGDLRLASGTGAVTTNGAAKLIGNTLRVDAVNTSTLNNANTVNTVAANVTGAGQGFEFANVGSFAVGTASGLTGVVSNGGAVVLKSNTGGITEGAAATVSADSLRLDAATTSTLTNANSVNTLAANISAVGQGFSFTNAGNFAIGTASGLAGVTTSSGAVVLTSTAGAITEAGAAKVSADTLKIVAGTSATLTNGNHANKLAAVTGTDFSYYDIGSLLIDTVGGVDGITSGGKVWVRAAADLTTVKPVIGNGIGNQAVVLSAVNAFRNQAGVNGVQAPNGRWLIYDDNPMLEDRLGGLNFDFRRLHTLYDNYLPPGVGEWGNGYITTTFPPDPEQYARQSGGMTSAMAFGNNTTTAVSLINAGETLSASLVQIAQTMDATLMRPAFALEGGLRPIPSGLPLVLEVTAGTRFVADLSSLALGGEIVSISTRSGEPLPAWLHIDLVAMRISGVAPVGASAVDLRIRVKGRDGLVQTVDLMVNPEQPRQITRNETANEPN